MDNVHKLRTYLFLFFAFFSFSAFAYDPDYAATSNGLFYRASWPVCSSLAAACPSSTILSDANARWPNQNNAWEDAVFSGAYLVTSPRLMQQSKTNGAVAYSGFTTTWTCPYGGTPSGATCVNVPECTPPLVRNSSTHVCENPPVTCPDGSTAPTLAQCPVQCTAPKVRDPASNSCIDPVCTAPQYNDPVTRACVDPKQCVPPELDNGFGICEVKECTNGKVNNVVTGECQLPPNCGATEIYYNPTNSCKLKELRCPEHSHANTANDQCLNDPPLTCPIGKHDDGTYHCVADDAKGCNSSETKGYIFGIAQCIPKPNLDTMQRAAQDAADAKAAAQASANQTAQALIAAKAALDADPTNPTKQASYDSAKSANDAAQTAAGKAADDATDSKGKLDSGALKDIADTVRSIDDRQKLADETGFGDIPDPEAVDTQTLSITQGNHNVSGSCPSPLVAGTTRGVFNISLQPVCDFATLLSPIVISLSWLAAAFIVFGYKPE